MPKSKKSKINNGKGGLKKMKNASKTKAQNNDEAEVQEVENENLKKVEEEVPIQDPVKVEISEPKEIPKIEETIPSLDLKAEEEEEEVEENQWETQKGKSYSSKMRSIKPNKPNPRFDKTRTGIKQSNGERTPTAPSKHKHEVSLDKTPTTLPKKIGPTAVSTPIEVAYNQLIEKERRESLKNDSMKNDLSEVSRNNESSAASSNNLANKTINQTDQSIQTSTTVNNSTSAAINDDDEGVDVSAGDSQDCNNNTSKDTTQNTSVDPEYVRMKHPLRFKWTLWHLGTTHSDWSKNLQPVSTVSTVEDFWSLYHYTKNPSQLKNKEDYSFFRSGIKPTWEAYENKNGGRFLFGQDSKGREVLNGKWLEILLYLIGDQASARYGNDRFSELICGVVLNVRKDCDKISLWMGVVLDEIKRRKDENKDKKAIELIGADFWDCMAGTNWMYRTHPGREIIVTFETHQDSQKKTGRIKEKSRMRITKDDRDAIRKGY